MSHKIEGILGIKRKNGIFDCKLLCSESDAKIIVPLHIHTGAVAISGFFGHEKKSVVKATFKSKEAHRLDVKRVNYQAYVLLNYDKPVESWLDVG